MPPAASSPFVQMMPFILIFLIFYFLVIKPEKDKRNDLKKTIDQLKKNDEVVTVGGIHGTVVLLKDKTVVLRVDENVKIEFNKDAIVSVIKSKKE